MVPLGRALNVMLHFHKAFILFFEIAIFSFVSKHPSVQYLVRNALTEGNPTSLPCTSQDLPQLAGPGFPSLAGSPATRSLKLQEASGNCSCYGPVRMLPHLHSSWLTISSQHHLQKSNAAFYTRVHPVSLLFFSCIISWMPLPSF